jgi:hypothetical protein
LLGSSSWISASMWQLGWDGGCRSHWWTMGWLPSWLWMGSLMYFSWRVCWMRVLGSVRCMLYVYHRSFHAAL